MTKKLLSIILAVMVLISSIATVSANTEAAQAPAAEMVIADFSNMSDIQTAGLTADYTDKIFGEKSGTLDEARLNGTSPAMSPIKTADNNLLTDWSAFTHYNLWVYSEEATGDRQFAVVIRTPGTSSNTAVRYINQDFAGWKKLSIELDLFTSGANFDISDIQDTYVSFVYGNLKVGSGKTGEWSLDKYKKVSFAKMWLSTEAETEDPSLIYASDSSSGTSSSLYKDTYAVFSTDVTDIFDRSLKLSGTKDTSNESKRWSFGEAKDWSSYNYLNFKVKNTAESASSFTISATVSGTVANADTGYWRKQNIPVEGNEWTTVSLAIPGSFKFESNASTPTVYTDFSHIEGIFFDFINGEFHLEKIWLSAEEVLPDILEVYNSDSSSETTSSLSKDTYAVLTDEAIESNDKSLKLYGTGASSGSTENETKRWAFGEAYDWTHYNKINLRVKNADASVPSSFMLCLTADGTKASAADGFWRKQNIAVEGSEWTTISLEIPTGFKFESNESTPVIYTVFSNIEGMFFDGIKGTFYLEKIWLTSEGSDELLTLSETSVEENAVISSLTRTISFTYADELLGTVPAITVAPETDFIADIEGNTLSIIFPEALNANASYTVTIDKALRNSDGVACAEDTVLNFTTDKFSTLKTDSAAIARYYDANAAAKLVIAVYNSEDSLAAVSICDAAALANAYAELSDGQFAKILVLDSFINVKPVEEAVVLN